jgi:hypothetical protein
VSNRAVSGGTMKYRNGASAALLVMMVVSVALPANAQERETRPLQGFDAVEVGGGIDLLLRQGERFVVEVASDDDVDDIVTEVRSGTLEIRRKQPTGSFDWGGDNGSASVTLPKLTKLVASGGTDVETEGTFSNDSLEIVASGGSEMAIDVSATVLDVQASGGSDLRISGRARAARMQSSGGSDLDARELMVEEAEVQSTGGSDLSVAVRDKIVGGASGGSDISYTGQPRTVDVDTSGGSDVSRR